MKRLYKVLALVVWILFIIIVMAVAKPDAVRGWWLLWSGGW